MSGSFSTFAARMRRRGRQVEEGVNRVVRTTALIADQNLVLSTPVDTGRARSNWQVSIGSPIESEREPFAPGELGSTAGPNAQAAIAQGEQVINRRQPEETIFITNNLPYIQRLNDGYSAQAPVGFVQTAVQRAVEYVRTRARVLFNGN